jgi:hypothetical protein
MNALTMLKSIYIVKSSFDVQIEQIFSVAQCFKQSGPVCVLKDHTLLFKYFVTFIVVQGKKFSSC